MNDSNNEKKRYPVGLLMGVFDLFHVGHLNLIENAKVHCDYLRVGVLSDALVFHFKNKYPIIPQEERMRILSALRLVDEVVPIDREADVSRIAEWRVRPFDCFFSGDDYRDNPHWIREREELRKLGVDVMFFPYTRSQSSTKIRETLRKAQSED